MKMKMKMKKTHLSRVQKNQSKKTAHTGRTRAVLPIIVSSREPLPETLHIEDMRLRASLRGVIEDAGGRTVTQHVSSIFAQACPLSTRLRLP